MESSFLPLSIFPEFDFNFSFFLNEKLLFFVLLIFFMFYSIVSSILLYHWHAYGMKNKGIIFGESVFLLVSIVLFVSAGLTLFYL